MKILSLKVPEILYERIAELAEEKGASKSEIIRETLEKYLSRSKKRANGSVLSLAKDLAGCLQGPSDLSVNKERLKDYGQ